MHLGCRLSLSVRVGLRFQDRPKFPCRLLDLEDQEQAYQAHLRHHPAQAYRLTVMARPTGLVVLAEQLYEQRGNEVRSCDW